MSFTVKANAKVNLFLEIINKRPDGYHNLKSVFHAINLFDELTFELSGTDIKLKCSDASLQTDETNLVYKAALAMKNAFNIKEGVNILLKKNIPMGAGLGGGSSDAATTINALNKLWNINADFETLRKLTSPLGADIAFFLKGGLQMPACYTALAEGIGDIITPI
ncbi:MAG: 4-(cytidine 5'-diphospho)-2-C-methyl-D-erythritol kinase, partial [Elusimicrobia bacterium]|nr:4-(cytidine 5'-diphospho)-2-C-methyl-D-erythritol kinase [Elusimicrobiota bacterium]